MKINTKIIYSVLMGAVITAGVVGMVGYSVHAEETTPTTGGEVVTETDKVALASAEAKITVTVVRNDIHVSKFNDSAQNASSRDADRSSFSIITYKRRNTMAFRADKDGYARLYNGDKIIWQGSVKGGESNSITFDIGDVDPGIYNLRLRLNESKDADANHGYTEIRIRVDYRAAIPTILPGNTGADLAMYVNIGGRLYSLTTAIVVLALILALVVLLSEKREYNDKHAKEILAKKKRIQRAKAKAKQRPAKLL